ncbi:mannose-1-phosphate guanylyltransferase [Carboxylicivirga sp. N1Y90]|uniref:mannose-1-phosphate guanylyltransferase n=1 Tax=Carboxylicivirga fragile TaxID=3417571 RepID=UPI003D32DC6B|nr:mannose-1-phosphate guanylyltransferase [Marinilabiliaceae bacterium N1Y90]
MTNNTYCVIMAGGVGSRFWPLSTSKTPKQFLDILGTGKSLLQQTYDRFKPLCPAENFVIVTSLEYKEMVLEQLPELTAAQVLAEPLRRNTAPCIAYANAVIEKQNPEANIVVTPADHLILNEEEFRRNINTGLDFVTEREALLTLGIKPSRPETGYGYIQIGDKVDNLDKFRKVKTFTEKPNLDMAKVFYESGEFFWNSGIFLWSLKSIKKAFQENLKEVSDLFESFIPEIGTSNEEKALQGTYSDCKNISIDYGVMEKANNVFVKMVDFGWSDLGTWSSLHEHAERNEDNNAVIKGNVLVYDSSNSIIHVPDGKMAVVQGLDNYIVIQSEKSLLICPKSNEQQIRQFTTDLKSEFGSDE